MKKEIEIVRKNANQSALKLTLAILTIENLDEDENWVSNDKELSKMLREAQSICHDICAYIDTRAEPRHISQFDQEKL